MFANRLRKNLQRLDPWAEREHIECFRVYDADMPEYAFAIDIYGRDARHVYVQEYAAPKTVDQESARERRREALAVLPEVLGVPLAQVHSRVRKPQKGAEQYEKRDSVAERHVVREGGLKFWVNFRDYLDTGLFLDHRIVRGMLRDWAKDADFLNLFCYTGSATVYAAAGGARSTTSVDLSNTYLGLGARESHCSTVSAPTSIELYRADCLEWLEEPGSARPAIRSDLPRSADLLEFQAHGGRARRAARPRRHDPKIAEAAAPRRPTGVLHQLHALQARCRGAARTGHRGHQRRDHSEGLRASRAHSSLLHRALHKRSRSR